MTSSSNGNPDTGPDPVPDADAASAASEFDSLESLDPLGFAEAWSKAGTAALAEPRGDDAGLEPLRVGARGGLLGRRRPRSRDPRLPARSSPGGSDRRFRDPAWEENPAFFAILQATCSRPASSATCSTRPRSTR